MQIQIDGLHDHIHLLHVSVHKAAREQLDCSEVVLNI